MGYSPVMLTWVKIASPSLGYPLRFPHQSLHHDDPIGPCTHACRKARRAAACSWAFKAKESPKNMVDITN